MVKPGFGEKRSGPAGPVLANSLIAFFLLALNAPAAIIPDHYIVELATPGVTEQQLQVQRSRSRTFSPDSHRRALRDEQAQVRGRLEARRARVYGSVETVANALFVELAGDQARAALAATPGVKRVVPAREFHRVMDRAVVVNRIADAWARIGDGRAGEGMKIAVIDTGVETSHPAFQDSSLKAPEGFPRFDTELDAGQTNNKIIVARSYVTLLPRRDPDNSARDRVGHGTALAAIIAGTRAAGPLATITGVAPRAYIGSYKVFGSPGINDGASDAAILKAIDDAVADGMDVINLSLGSDLATRLEDDLEVEAIERATKAGVIVVVSAGNNGPGLNTLASPGTAPSAITVGSVTNDRAFAASAEIPGRLPFVAIPGDGPAPSVPVTAPIADVASLTGAADGLACQSMPASSLKGMVALIMRGSCNFESKLNNAQAAGAVAALVFAAEAAPSPFIMGVGAATLPAEMISYNDGVAIRQAILDNPGLVITLNFTRGPVSVAGGRRSSFSAAGPSVDLRIKPDLVAVGSSVYVPTQTLDPAGDMYDRNGFLLVNGTSFSAPIVAGAAALLKSARPGLTAEQYRSLIVNTAADAFGLRGEASTLQQTGAGLLDVAAGLDATVTAVPSSLSFGVGGSTIDARRTLTLTNLGRGEDTFTIDAGAGALTTPALTLARGASGDLPVTWRASGLAAGAQEGFLVVRSAATGSTIRVPYWYAVKGTAAASLTVIDTPSATGRRGATVRDAVLFRVLDSAGVNLDGADPTVTVKAGDGTARPVVSYDDEIPGLFGVTVQLGLTPGANTFEIKAGEATYSFTITGQ